MNNTFDIVVIGAGIAGVSLAAQLSSDCKVLLLDMEAQPGFHATGRSAAFYAPAYGNEVVRAITVASEDFFRRPPTGFSDALLLKPRDALFIASDDQTAALTEQLRENPHLQPVNKTEINHQVPILDTNLIKQGAIDTTGGDLDVDAIMQGYLKMFKSQAGVLTKNAKVTGLKWSAGNWSINTTTGNFAAPIVVNAAGAWADSIAELAGLGRLGITPYRRTALLVDAPVDQDISNWPLVIDINEEFYFKPDAGQLLISPADETVSTACDAFPDELDIAVAIDRVKQITNLAIHKVNHAWAGLRSFAPDKTFVAGFDSRTRGFYWLAGQGGYGVQSAPALAAIAAFQITGSHGILSSSMLSQYAESISPDRLL